MGQAFCELGTLKDKLSLSDSVIEKAAYIYRKGSRGQEDKGSSAGGRLDLHQRQDGLAGLLRLLAFADQFADAAGIFPIEGLRERVAQRGLLREADEHAGPRDRLEQHPVQPHGKGYGEDDSNFGGALEQDGAFDASREPGIQEWSCAR